MPKFTVTTEIDCGTKFCNQCVFKFRVMYASYCTRHHNKELYEDEKTGNDERCFDCREEERNLRKKVNDAKV